MIIKIYSFILIFFIPISFAMDDQQDRQYHDRLQKALLLPADIMQKVGVFPSGADLYICSSLTWLYNQKLDLISANHQNLSIKNGQLEDRVQWDNNGKWHVVEHGQPHQPLTFEKQPKGETDWLYDGPNKQYAMVAVATERKEVNSSQEETTRQKCNSFVYKFPYQPVLKHVPLSGMLPNTNIVALALAYKSNAYALADCRDPNSYLTIVDQNNEQTTITLEQNFIKRLIFPTGKLLYALSQEGTLYRIDSGKIVAQTFKDSAGKPIKIDDFAINMQSPSLGALVSSNKFYVADMLHKKLRYMPIEGLEKNTGLCQLKMFGDRIGIMMRNYDEYTIAMLDIAKIPRAKIKPV